MNREPAQLALAVQLRDGATFDNFLATGNTLLLNELQQLGGSGERFIYLYGAAGSGRSHLLQACCHRADQQGRRAVYLPLAELAAYPPEQVVAGADQFDLVCLDDIEAVLGDRNWEQALFGLFNTLLQQDAALLVAAGVAPRQLGCALADLQSRLSWGAAYQLRSQGVDHGKALLQYRARQRGMLLSDEVANYIYHRCRRDPHSLMQALDLLDRRSLQARRRLTIPFVREVLHEQLP